MKKLTLKDLRAIPPYAVIGRGRITNGKTEVWIFIKLPNHFWTGYRGHPSLTERELAEYGQIIPKDEVRELVDCDDEVLKRYEVLEREGVN